MGIYDHEISPNYQPDPYVHHSVAALTSAIISSIPTDVAAAIIKQTMQINPELLEQEVHTHV